MPEKVDRLVFYIERWIGGHQRRNVSLLSRISGVPYPTLRRVLLKESIPTLENAMAILNRVASLHETMDYFDDNASIRDFSSRFNPRKEATSDAEEIGRLLKRESFWIIAMALTVGATRARVEKLLGSFGVAEFQSMIEEGFLHEESLNVYRASAEALQSYIDSKKIGDEVLKHIAEFPLPQDSTMKRFLTYNVNAPTYVQMKQRLHECFLELSEMASSNPGEVMMVSSLSILRVLDVGEVPSLADQSGRQKA